MTTESIKPWEPVSGWFVDPEGPMGYRPYSWPWNWACNDCANVHSDQALRVTLANGQTIIVRAMSERRKADRRTRDSRGMTAAERFQWKGG